MASASEDEMHKLMERIRTSHANSGEMRWVEFSNSGSQHFAAANSCFAVITRFLIISFLLLQCPTIHLIYGSAEFGGM